MKHPYLAQEKGLLGDKSELSNVSYVYYGNLNMIAHKIIKTLAYIDAGEELVGRSWYLLTDIYKLASYSYEKYGESLLTDAGFDRLAKHLDDSRGILKDAGIIPNVIKDDELHAHTGSGVTLADKDLALLKLIMTVMGLYVEAPVVKKPLRKKLRLRKLPAKK
jgi:hypothetical protein